MIKTLQHTTQGRIYKIQKYCLHDGPGIRTCLFFQGCPLKCQWCHNPESQSFTGKADTYSVHALVNEIEKDLIFYDQSKGGVTFSGGEPLSQAEFLLDMIEECRKRQIHTCIDTSGHCCSTVFKKICNKVDMVLFDIKLIDDDLHRQFTGVSVKDILDNLQFLSTVNTPVKIRIPLIPKITDTDDNIDDILSLLADFKRFKDVNLLAFHNTGQGKYEKLGMKNLLKELQPGSKKTDEIEKKFKQNGFTVTIGG